MPRPKQVVEQVLGTACTRDLWAANYYPALPFAPQAFTCCCSHSKASFRRDAESASESGA